MSRWPRPLLLAGALTLTWTLACSGLTDRVKGAVANQAAKALADAMGVPAEQVTVTPLDSGRWTVDTPNWDANCGLGPQAKMPAGFAFAAGEGLMGDCTVDASCKEVMGVPCDTDLGLALVVHTDGTPQKKLIGKRTKELEGKGWTVVESKDKDNKDTTVLTAKEGNKARAVAVISQSDGSSAEILIGPIQ